MKNTDKFFKDFFKLKIETCRSIHGNFVIKLSTNHHEYFHIRKDAREYIKNYMKED